MKNLLLTLLMSLTISVLFSQLTVTTEDDDVTFVYSLAGPGITVSDVVRTCADGASGFFNSMDANVGIDSGMILTSGSITNAIGPNNINGATGYNGTAGDPDLDATIGYPTYDGCVIEFNMTVAADTLRLNYVFASEEYLEYAGSAFNDVFAFWLSGPGIVDTVNIALVPGTSSPVAINNINDVTNPDYYIDNGSGYEEPYMSDSSYIQYDGLTTVLEAYSLVTAGETYHMKIAIADVADGVFDSGVFLETGSLGSLRLNHEVTIDLNSDYAVEKCASGYFKLINEVPSAEPLVIDYMIAGSATNGVDYEEIPDQLIIPAWDSIGIIEITPKHDAIYEGLESVELYLYNPQSGFIYDTLSMLIKDELDLPEFASTVDDLTAYFNDLSGLATTWNWDFGDGFTSTEQNPVHVYAEPGSYNVCLTITDEIGCDAEYCKTVDAGVTGIENLNTASFTISANPVGEFVTIALQYPSPGTEIFIRNLLGEIVKSVITSDASVTISTAGLTKGMYFIEVKNEHDTKVQQVEKL